MTSLTTPEEIISFATWLNTDNAMDCERANEYWRGFLTPMEVDAIAVPGLDPRRRIELIHVTGPGERVPSEQFAAIDVPWHETNMVRMMDGEAAPRFVSAAPSEIWPR